jgi:regulator of sigma E protease
MIITLGIFQTLGNIILFLIVLGVIICVHELGHLYFAKKAGILCHEFSFGMGPRLWSIKKGETIYSIRAIPIGGFVSMSGEELEEEIIKVGDKVRLDFDKSNVVKNIIINPNNPKYQDLIEVTVETIDLKSDKSLFINQYSVKQDAMYIFDKREMQIAPLNRRFASKTKWQRFIATFGGPMMNFVLAFVVYLIIAFAVGVPNTGSTEISSVNEAGPAYGILMDGDKIVSINGVDVETWTGSSNSVSSELNKTIDGYIIVVERDGQLVTLDEIKPLMLFYSLGFQATNDSNDLIIKAPIDVLAKSELKAGDKILNIEDTQMNTWEDVINFVENNKAGSESKEDLYKMTVYRQTISEYSGYIASVKQENGVYVVEINPTGEQENIIYNIGGTETLLVSAGSQVVAGEALGSGGNYDIQFVLYGDNVLEAVGVTPFDSVIGIEATNHFSFFGSIGSAFNMLISAGTSIFGTLGLLFTSNLVGVSDLSGFVGIFSLTSRAASAGIITLLSFVGFLSVNLGIVNLLPIPALDGGRIVFIGYEAIFKKKPNQKVENWLHTIVFFLLMALMLYVTYNDILKLFGI